MDVRLFCAVLWRFKRLVIGGSFLAAVLAVLAYGSPTLSHGKPTIIPRGGESWQSVAELLITQASFPYGRAAQQYTPGSPKTNTPSVPVGDQQYMSGLAPVYAALANGNAVKTLIHQAAPVPGTVVATELTNAATSQPLPFVDLTATAPTSGAAARLASAAAAVLGNYVGKQQTAAGIAPNDRIQLQVVQNGLRPQLVSGHKPTIPVLVFVAVLGAAIALALTLESVWPRTAAALGRVPAGAGYGSLAARSPSAASLNRGPAVVRLDHLLAGMHGSDPESDAQHDPAVGEADRQYSNGQADDHLNINGGDYVAANVEASPRQPSSHEPDGTASAAKSLWETAQQNWTAAQGRQGASFGSDSDG
jgi:hypothetical protein